MSRSDKNTDPFDHLPCSQDVRAYLSRNLADESKVPSVTALLERYPVVSRPLLAKIVSMIEYGYMIDELEEMSLEEIMGTNT